MKVALLTPWFVSEQSVGGTERFVNDLAYSLVDNGYEVDVYMLSGKSYKHRNINYISLDLTPLTLWDYKSLYNLFTKMKEN